MNDALDKMRNNAAEKLDLSKTEIGLAGLSELCAALRENRSLTELDLRCTGLGDAAAKPLAEAIKEHPALKCVDLRENGVGVAGGSAIAEVLGQRMGVVRLDMFDRESALREAALWTGGATTPEALAKEEPRMEGVDVLLTYYREHEAELMIPAFALRAEIVEKLANRALVRRARALAEAGPDADGRRVRRPLIIAGLFRTGTTLLYNLLAAPPGVRAPRLWEMMGRPVPPATKETYETDPRIAEVERKVAGMLQLAPEMRHIHNLDARAPEECAFLFRSELMMLEHAFSREAPPYADWLERQDFRELYRSHRRALELMASSYPPAGHWVLKAPWHLWHLPELWAEYPDANLVFMHRSPVEVVASSLSLMCLFPTKTWRTYDARAHAPRILKMLAEGWSRAIAARSRMEAEGKGRQMLDCQYRELVADPVGTAKGICERMGYELTPEGEEKMREVLAANPKDKHGQHKYTLEQFGLTVADVREAFAEYNERFGGGRGPEASA